ncbi:MAG: VWA domain-containing protein, partial [Acidobacteriota bacterium]
MLVKRNAHRHWGLAGRGHTRPSMPIGRIWTVWMAGLLWPVLMMATPVPPAGETSPAPAAGAARETSPAVKVQMVEPAPGAFVTGPAAIEARVDVAPGFTLLRVEFQVNGQVVAAPTSPPWRIMHDFGPGYEAWYIRVKAVTTTGETADAAVTTRPLMVNESVKVDVVSLYATVRDRRGHYLMDLEADDFFLLEDGRRQQITSFSRERLPLALEIVLDTSKSMQGRSLDEARRAATSFLNALEPEDLVGVMEFNDRVHDLHPLDTDRKGARKAIAAARARGGTALYDAVARAAGQLQEITSDRRLALILLSDGRDEAYSGLTPGSRLTFEESLGRVVDSGVILYAIGLGQNPAGKLDFYGHHSLEEILQILARQTGGQAYFTRKADRL